MLGGSLLGAEGGRLWAGGAAKPKGKQCDSRAKSGGSIAPHTEPQVHGPDGGRNKDPRLLSGEDCIACPCAGSVGMRRAGTRTVSVSHKPVFWKGRVDTLVHAACPLEHSSL